MVAELLPPILRKIKYLNKFFGGDTFFKTSE
jgi:hypothetical protein